MEAEDIERYLAELGAELKNRGLKKPVRILLTDFLGEKVDHEI